MRARYPDSEGYADVDGDKVFYEVFGEGNSPTVMLIHGWQIGHSRSWKMQVPYLSRHYRVITYDWPGNGKSDRPEGVEAYDIATFGRHVHAVLDASGTDRAVLVGESGGVLVSLFAAAERPDRMQGLVLTGGVFPVLAPTEALMGLMQLDEPAIEPEGWAKARDAYWQDGGWLDFARFFAEQIIPEPHSTKAHDDLVEWAGEASIEACAATMRSLPKALLTAVEPACEKITSPVLVVHGTTDIIPIDMAEGLAAATNGSLLVLDGCGHVPLGRDPVRFNVAVREFVDRVCPPAPKRFSWVRALSRPPKVLYLSSPIGLGHALRDVAVASELRALRPEVEVDWLAQHPVTAVLERRGERVHPASAALVNESSHIESESAEHDLHVFQAYRDMDEILCANFMVLHDLLQSEPYDLVVGDEAWELDHFWHENPELKSLAYVWLTDFVGWLPVADEGAICADYNAEMIVHVERFPRLRDRALFVGDPDDIVGGAFGPGLPSIREWTEAHYQFPGYISGFDHTALDRDALRDELGWAPGERVVVAAVGGTGVGAHLLRRVVAAYPAASRRVDGLRMVAVAGPRIDPASLDAPPGVEVVGYVPDLYRLLAASDLAIVQGGLTTSMELTALRRPFVYVPLQHHFEQQFHVRHRLQRYRAGVCLDYPETADPDRMADIIACHVAQPIDYRPVATDGAARAARMIADLV